MTHVIVVPPDLPAPHIIKPAADALRHGDLVAFPTETVYGLGANTLDADAVAKIFVAKGRPATDPLIVHVPDIQQVATVADLSDLALTAMVERIAAEFWPGPLTLILPKRDTIPDNVTAGLNSVGVRIPDHPIALSLLKLARVPIAAPSANRFSHPSPTRALHVFDDLKNRIEWLIDGGSTEVGIESTVLDLTQATPTILRPGGTTVESLIALLGDVDYTPRVVADGTASTGPGMLLKHYAPNTPFYLIEGAPQAVIRTTQQAANDRPQQKIGIIAPDFIAKALDEMGLLVLGLGDMPAEIAASLYAAIRDLDRRELDVIIAIHVHGDGVLVAVRDRLYRAAEGNIIPTIS